jgi:hypothetical protein
MDLDILRCQKMQNAASGVVLHLDSDDLHRTRFFDKKKLEPLLYSLLLVVSFSVYGLSFLFSQVGRFSDGGISLMTSPGRLPTPDRHLIELRVRELYEI